MANTLFNNCLNSLGINEKLFVIYKLLFEYGKMSVVKISKYTGISRPSVYRAINKLVIKGLVEIQIENKKTFYRATNVETLNKILQEKESKLTNVKNILPEVINSLNSQKLKHKSESYVTYYKGIDGIKQVLWNSLGNKKNQELLVYGYLNLYDNIGEEFIDIYHIEEKTRKTKIYELTNESHDSGGWTKQVEYFINYYQERYIPSNIIKINQDLMIYQDTVAHINYIDDDYFATEIHNANIANLQRQLFWLVWSKGKELRPFDN